MAPPSVLARALRLGPLPQLVLTCRNGEMELRWDAASPCVSDFSGGNQTLHACCCCRAAGLFRPLDNEADSAGGSLSFLLRLAKETAPRLDPTLWASGCTLLLPSRDSSVCVGGRSGGCTHQRGPHIHMHVAVLGPRGGLDCNYYRIIASGKRIL